MLLLGFGAALRRTELVGLRLGDVERVPDKGLLLTIGRSKTDQHGKGQRVAVWANPTEPGFCPAAALDAWLAHRRTAPDLDWTRERFRARRTPAVLRCHQGRPGHRRKALRQGGGAADQAGRRRGRAGRAKDSPATRSAVACSPPAATTGPSSPT